MTPHADPHLHATEHLARHLGVQLDQGLPDGEAAERLERHGPNRLPEPPPRPWLLRLMDPFRDFMVLVLLAAAVISGFVGDLADTLVIAVIVLLNAAIGLWQEWRAEQALQSLAKLTPSHARVRREGQQRSVPAEHLVPGDVVLLDAGDQVPADLRLAAVARLRVDESALTGESTTVEKTEAHLEAGEHAVADRRNMAWKGTLVTHGRAEGLVVATGGGTELGRIAALLGSAPVRATPLQQRLAVFGRQLSIAAIAICVAVFVLGLVRGEPPLLMALTAISLAVAAIPEALPAVVSVLLALGARRLAAVQALVRRLPSVETLGSVTVIASDKTGTLTLNRMTVREHHAAAAGDAALWRALLLCNDAVPAAEGFSGDPTETALLVAARAAGLDIAAVRSAAPRVHEWPFDAARKRMATLHAEVDGTLTGLVKGAPESVLPRCHAPGEADALAQRWAAQGLRVLAVARRAAQGADRALEADDFEQGLELLGLVGLIDPPRPEAREAVAECRSAGIRPVLITGDHPATGAAIARDLGIATGAPGEVLTGAELARMDTPALAAAAAHTAVYARVDPAQKLAIVQALQARGEVVAMTGDGVNDAPALKSADIGVAMGRGGTDVAREAASLVLLDDNFSTIVAAVREGRRIFDNIRKFVRYALTGNSGEIWVLFAAPLLGLPLPLLPIHILWINLVTDGLPGLALAAEPAERGVMQRPPRPPGESVLAHGLWQHALVIGALMGAGCLGLQAWVLAQGGAQAAAQAQTMVFTALTFAQMAHLLAIRSERESLFTQGLLSNRPLLGAVALTLALQMAVVYLPALQPVFRTVALGAGELASCAGVALAVFVAVEAEKAWRRRR